MKKGLHIAKNVALALGMILLVAGCKPTPDLEEPTRTLDFRLIKNARSSRAITDKDITYTDTPVSVYHSEPLTDEDISKMFIFEKDAAGVKVTVKPHQTIIANGIYDIRIYWIDNTNHWNVRQLLNKEIIDQFNNYQITEYTWIYPITNEGVTYRLVGDIGYNNPDGRDGFYSQAEYEITAGGGVGCPSDLPEDFTDEGYVEVKHDVLKVIDVIPVEIGTVEKIWRSGVIYEQAEEGKFSWDDNHWVTQGLIEGTTSDDLLEMNFNDTMDFQYEDWGGDIITSAPYISVQFQYYYTIAGYNYCTFQTPDLHSANDENTYFSQPVSARLDMTRLYPLDPDFEITVVQDEDGVRISSPDVGSDKKYSSVKVTNGVDTGNHEFYSKEEGYVYPFVVPGTTYRFTGLLRNKDGEIVARTNSAEITPKNGHGSVLVDADYTLYTPTIKTYPTVAKLNRGATGKATPGNITGKDAKVGYAVTMYQTDDPKSRSYWSDWMHNYWSDDYDNITLQQTNTWDDVICKDYYNLTMDLGEYCVLKDGTVRFERTTGEYVHKQNWVPMPLLGQTKTVKINGTEYKITFDYGRKCTVSVNGGASKNATWTRTAKDSPLPTAELITLTIDSENVEFYYDYANDTFSKNPLLGALTVDTEYKLKINQDSDGLKIQLVDAAGSPAKLGSDKKYNHYWLFNDQDDLKVDSYDGDWDITYPCVTPGKEYNFTAVLIDPKDNKVAVTKSVKVTPENGHGSVTFEKLTSTITATWADKSAVTAKIVGSVKGTTTGDIKLGYMVYTTLTNDKNSPDTWGSDPANERIGKVVTDVNTVSLLNTVASDYKYMNMTVDVGVVYTKADGSTDFLNVINNPWSGQPAWLDNPLYGKKDLFAGIWRTEYDDGNFLEWILKSDGTFVMNNFDWDGGNYSCSFKGNYTFNLRNAIFKCSEFRDATTDWRSDDSERWSHTYELNGDYDKLTLWEYNNPNPMVFTKVETETTVPEVIE